jgi:NADH-quinone oxidoreductase subunit C
VDGTELLDFLSGHDPERIVERHNQTGDATVVIQRASMLEFFLDLKGTESLDFNFLMDITAVDYLTRPERFEVVYHLYSLSKNHRLRVKVRVPEKNPEVDSLVHLWKSANWLEREVWDMYGIRFKGHPDLRRVLMYEQFEGYPLRKDYPANWRQPLVEHREIEGTFCDAPDRK